MTQYIRLTEAIRPWFHPLLPPQFQAAQEDRGVYLIGAVQDSAACGVLAFQLREGIADIRYLVVAEGYRRQGIARGMIGYLCRHAWPSATPVTCTFSAPDKNDGGYLLFAELENFSVDEEEGCLCRVPLAGLAQDPALAAFRGRGHRPVPFFSLPAAERRRFRLSLLRQGIYYLRDVEEALLPELCLCTQGKGGISAAVFLSQKGEDLELTCAWSAPGANGDLAGLLGEISARLPGQGTLWIAAVTPASEALVEKLLPQRTVAARYYRAVWDMELEGGEDDGGAQ